MSKSPNDRQTDECKLNPVAAGSDERRRAAHELPALGGAVLRIFAVEDDIEQRLLIQKCLETKFELMLSEDAVDIVNRVKSYKPDLILLDVCLRTGGGFEACALLQRDPQTRGTPVVFLTAKSDTDSKVLGFSIGAQDYIVKPYDPLELEARIQARIQKSRQEFSAYIVGPVRLDVLAQTAWVQQGDQVSETHLTPHEFRLLCHMARHEGRAFTRQELLDAVWGVDTHVVDRVVDTTVSSLRKKLPEIASLIETVFGHGYKLKAA